MFLIMAIWKIKPTNIILDCEGHGIGLNASQTLCLVTNIPLIFGDLVPEDNLHCCLLLLLLNIINIVFSYCITEGMTVYLKHLIVELHQLFKELYPSKKLLPKHHFMVHYPKCLRKIGPLIHIWTMRFEAKDNFFFLAKVLANKDICSSISLTLVQSKCVHLRIFRKYKCIAPC